MKCKFCDGSGKDYWCLNGEPYPCPVCNGTGEYEPFNADIELAKLYPTEQTNEEWFCKLTTYEKAQKLFEMYYLQDWKLKMLDYAEKEDVDVFEAIRRWLKEKHNDNMGRNP